MPSDSPQKGSVIGRDGKSNAADLAGTDAVVPAHAQAEPMEEFSAWVKEEMRRVMRLMAKMVRYSDHWRQEVDGEVSTLSADSFTTLLNLAAQDIFWPDTPDEKKLRNLGAKTSDIRNTPDWLDQLRSDPAFLPIRDDLDEKMVAIRDGNVEEMASFFGGVAAFESAQTMLFGRKDRDRNDAAKEFLDRTSPKKSRGDGNNLVVIIPDNFQDVLRNTMDIMEARGGSEDDPAISAKVVRTPSLPAKAE